VYKREYGYALRSSVVKVKSKKTNYKYGHECQNHRDEIGVVRIVSIALKKKSNPRPDKRENS
jgi:hypothetical protein